MKRKVFTALVICMLIFQASIGFAKGKEPKTFLYEMAIGDISAPHEGRGEWVSEHPDIAAVDKNGVISALSEGYTLVLLKNKSKIIVRCEVKVGDKQTPKEIEDAVNHAIEEWKTANGEAFPRFNKYTKWYRESAYKGFGWCGAFVGYNLAPFGIEMNEKYRGKDIKPIMDGRLFAVRQASQTRLFEGFKNYNRISKIPQEGYYIIYGKKGSTPYTHVGLVSKSTYIGEGKYVLETVEGNLNNRIRRYAYLYDSLAKNKEKNIKKLPEELRPEGDGFIFDYVSNFYITVFGQTWY